MRFVIRWGLVAGCGVLAVLWAHAALTSGGRAPFFNDRLVMLAFLLMTLPFAFARTSTPSDREFARGLPGAGTVVDARRTGLTVNGQPEMDILMDVETATGETFRATGRRVVDLAAVASLRPGAVLAVRHVPGRRDGMVMIDLDATPEQVQDLLQEAAFARGEIPERSMEVYRRGVATTALVLEMTPTGEVRDGAAVLDLLLRVARPDGGAFDVRTEKAIPSVGVPDVQPGRVVNARFLPGGESDVLIEHRVE